MNEPFNSKPEPLPAKSKWHYDSYYLSQLERLNLRQPTHTIPKTGKIAHEAPEIKSLKKQVPANVTQEAERQFCKRDEVIKRIYELAASIGISVTIVENPKLAA